MRRAKRRSARGLEQVPSRLHGIEQAQAIDDAGLSTALNHPRVLPEGEATWLIEDVRERIATFSGRANLALVTHRETINTLSFELIKHAEIVVLAPDGTDGFAVLGRLTIVS